MNSMTTEAAKNHMKLNLFILGEQLRRGILLGRKLRFKLSMTEKRKGYGKYYIFTSHGTMCISKQKRSICRNGHLIISYFSSIIR